MTNSESNLLESPIGKTLTAAGYSIWNTGGGIMAWGRETASRTVIYIGQGDGDIGENGDRSNWGTSVTNVDGGHVEWLDTIGTLDHCIAAMAKVDAKPESLPKPGTRVRFISDWDIYAEDVLIKEGERGTVVAADGDFAVKMDRHIENLDEWNNEVFLSPGDFAEDNDVSEAGWVLLQVEAIEDDADLYACPDCEWHGSRRTAAQTETVIKREDYAESVADIECPTCGQHVIAIPGLAELTREFNVWCIKNEMPHESADELYTGMLYAPDEEGAIKATEEQKAYVLDFIERWDAACRAERTVRDGERDIEAATAEELLIKGAKAWAEFMAQNDGDLGINLPEAECLELAKSADGLWLGGGAVPLTHVRYVEVQ